MEINDKIAPIPDQDMQRTTVGVANSRRHDKAMVAMVGAVVRGPVKTPDALWLLHLAGPRPLDELIDSANSGILYARKCVCVFACVCVRA